MSVFNVTDPASSGSTTVYNVDVSTIDATPYSLIGNGSRCGVSICNTSNKDIFVLVGSSTPSIDNCTVVIPAYSGSGGSLTYEMPYLYHGEVNILAESAGGAGFLTITEFIK